MKNSPQSFRARLAKGEVVYGLFCKTTAPEFVECAGFAGFDFCILDMEHGPVGFETLQNLIRGAEVSGIVPIVRTSDASEGAVAHPLDLAAAGVQVPQVNSLAAAEGVVRAAKFAPQGERGVCRFVRAADFSSMDRTRYFPKANEALVILQLEGTAIDSYREIAALDGVDVLFIGPYDLSQSLGKPGQVDDPEVQAKIREIIALAKTKGKAVGIFADTPAQAKRWVEAGVQYIAYSVDVGIFTDACRNLVTTLKAL